MSGIRAEVLRSYSRLLRLVLNEVNEPIVVFGPGGEVVLSNRALENLLGAQAEPPDHGDVRELLEGLGAKVDAATLGLLLGPESARLRLEMRDGSSLECRVTPLSLEHEADHRLLTFGGVPPTGLDLHELRRRAFHDSLTGLPNRELLLDRLEQALARRARDGGAIGVVFVDLDGFKQINDRHGHAAGDQVLIEVAERLAREIRPMDTVGRLGGDEFVIVCGGLADTHGIELVCGRVQRALEEPFHVNGVTLEVRASTGAVVEWDSLAVADELLARADEQMYRAKRLGTRVEVGRRAASGADDRHPGHHAALLEALGEERFELLYLPLISLEVDRVVGVEGLLRCTDPRLRSLNPIDLIHIAEDSGAISRLNALVLHHASLAARMLQRSTGVEMGAHVNLSSAQLADPALSDHIAAATRTAGIDPRRLGFDIAESVITAGSDELETHVGLLAGLGCGLFADDVTSAAAIEPLSRLGIGAVKIDGAAIEAATDAPHVAEELRRLVSLAHDRQISVVAEGIVDERTLRTARQIGSDGAQGYGFYGFPRPIEQLAQLIH